MRCGNLSPEQAMEKAVTIMAHIAVYKPTLDEERIKRVMYGATATKIIQGLGVKSSWGDLKANYWEPSLYNGGRAEALAHEMANHAVNGECDLTNLIGDMLCDLVGGASWSISQSKAGSITVTVFDEDGNALIDAYDTKIQVHVLLLFSCSSSVSYHYHLQFSHPILYSLQPIYSFTMCVQYKSSINDSSGTKAPHKDGATGMEHCRIIFFAREKYMLLGDGTKTGTIVCCDNHFVWFF